MVMTLDELSPQRSSEHLALQNNSPMILSSGHGFHIHRTVTYQPIPDPAAMEVVNYVFATNFLKIH